MQRSIFFLLLLAATGAGCKREAVIVPADRVYTVDEYLAAPELRRRVSAACSNDPGRTAQDPNCVNVHRADRVAAAGTLGGMPRTAP
jgi:hypothetical protein